MKIHEISPLFPAAGHEADRDFGSCIAKAVAHEITVKILDGNDIPLLKFAGDGGDFIVIDPHASGLQGAAFSFF